MGNYHRFYVIKRDSEIFKDYPYFETIVKQFATMDNVLGNQCYVAWEFDGYYYLSEFVEEFDRFHRDVLKIDERIRKENFMESNEEIDAGAYLTTMLELTQERYPNDYYYVDSSQ